MNWVLRDAKALSISARAQLHIGINWFAPCRPHESRGGAQSTREQGVNRSSWCLAAIAALIFSAKAFPNLYARASGNRTFTGEVGDAMCGRKHMEDEPSAECTRACVAHGSTFALIVGDKIYDLEATDKSALATLDAQAGKTATVGGSVDGDTIQVSSVVAK